MDEFDDVRDDVAVQTLHKRIKDALAQGASASSVLNDRITLLQLIRKRHLRYSAIVVEHGSALMDEYKLVQQTSGPMQLVNSLLGTASSSLTMEIWPIYEQVCIAAMDSHVHALRNTCITALETRFKNTSRVGRLRALVYDSADCFEEASQWYDRAVRIDRSAMAPRRREAAHHRMQGKFSDAIAILAEYCDSFSEDAAAWSELADLYIAAHKLEEARFALEELLLLRPEAWTVPLRYADVLYTIGGVPNTEMALTYYAAALELKPSAGRAALGLVLSIRALAVAGIEKSHYPALVELAQGVIAQAAKEAGLGGDAVDALVGMGEFTPAPAAATAAPAPAASAKKSTGAPASVAAAAVAAGGAQDDVD